MFPRSTYSHRSLSHGTRGAYYRSYIRNDGNVKYVDDNSPRKPPLDLLTFLQPTAKETFSPIFKTTIKIPSISRSISNPELWLGPKNSYLVQDIQKSSWQHDGLPAALVDAMKLYNTNGRRTNPVRLWTLGYGRRYFAASRLLEWLCDPEVSESMFQTNVTDTGGLDFGAGERVVAAHGLDGITDSGACAIASNSFDAGGGSSQFDGGGDSGGARVSYSGGDGGGGGGGAIRGFGF
ncbi:hypothetical protein DL98DRAFT_654991 [Cadophora sp. DSE1049]|nr:hypothetical protein DL98DRAFT_654991 [Cadophora sp. DSE1049]